MKRISLFLIFTIWTSLSAIAANLIVAGSLSNQDGSPVAGHSIEILLLRGDQVLSLLNTQTNDQGAFQVETDMDYNEPGIWVKVSFVNCNGARITEFLRPQPNSNSNVLFFKLIFCVTDQNGCKAQIKWHRDSTDALFLEAIGNGSAPLSYLWSTGDTTAIIPYPGPGRHCVTITDSKGCVAETCFMQNSDKCKVTISRRGGNVGTQLTAITAPPTGATYLWNTGDTTKSIVVLRPGNYCVTVTFPNGCTASACTLDQGPPEECIQAALGVEYDSVPSATLTVIHPDSLNYNYFWSTGENTQSIHVTNSGLYKVLVVDPSQRTCRKVLFVYINFNKCEVKIFAIRNNAGYTLKVVSTTSNAQPGSILWSTGETTATIQVPDLDEEYCVEAIIGDCVAEDCIGGNNDGGAQGGIEIERSRTRDNRVRLRIKRQRNIVSAFWNMDLQEEILVESAGTYTAIGVDSNGKSVYQSIQITAADLANQSPDNQITLYPTMVENEVNIVWPSELQNGSVMQVFNMKGQLVKQFNLNATHAGSTEVWNTADLSPGLYILNTVLKGQSLNARFIKK